MFTFLGQFLKFINYKSTDLMIFGAMEMWVVNIYTIYTNKSSKFWG